VFLQETKTKRGGKTYISYLVRESFRTANGPRGRTICNLTHLPKEVRDMVARALKGELLVPINHLEVNNIHSFGGCVVLDDAARRHGIPDFLAPLDARNAALVRAMIFGGLLNPPSVAPFHLEARTARLAMFCGLDPDKERFDAADLTAALRELDERWPEVALLLRRPPHIDPRVIALFRTSESGKQIGLLGMDPEGVPVPWISQDGTKADPDPDGFLRQLSRQPKGAQSMLALDEETSSSMAADRLENQPYIVEMSPDSVATLLGQLNHAQLSDSMRKGGPVEARHRGKRHVLVRLEAEETPMRMGSLKELAGMAVPGNGRLSEPGEPNHAVTAAWGVIRGIATNIPAERLPAATALQWANRAREARAAFVPVQVVMRGPAGGNATSSSGEGVQLWRNHQSLQFLTHRLRCHLHAEWSACGETRPVEEVLRDLQEVHRATLTVDGVVVRRLATHPPKAVATLLEKLNLWDLFETPPCTK